MHADDPLRAARGHGDIDDRDGRGVGGQDSVGRGHDLVEGSEDLGLEVERLDDRLDDQVAVSQVSDLGGERQVAEGRSVGRLVELASLQGAVQGLMDPGLAPLDNLRSHLTDHGGQASLCRQLGHAPTHLSSAHDSDTLDTHRSSWFPSLE